MSPSELPSRLRARRQARAGDEDGARWIAIAAQVTAQRQALSLTQQELAELCGTTQSAIARIERGARPPRLDTLLRISSALDCELVVELKPKTQRQGD